MNLLLLLHLTTLSLFPNPLLAVNSFQSYEPTCENKIIPAHIAAQLKLNNLREWCVTGATFQGTLDLRSNKRFQVPVVQCECDPVHDHRWGQYSLLRRGVLRCQPRYDALQNLPDQPRAYANELLQHWRHLFDGRVCNTDCHCGPIPDPSESTAAKLARLQTGSALALADEDGNIPSNSRRGGFLSSSRRTISQRVFDSIRRRFSDRRITLPSANDPERQRLCEGVPCSSNAECGTVRSRPTCASAAIACVATGRRQGLAELMSGRERGNGQNRGLGLVGMCMSIETFSPDHRSSNLQRWMDEGGMGKRDGRAAEQREKRMCMCSKDEISEDCCYSDKGLLVVGDQRALMAAGNETREA